MRGWLFLRILLHPIRWAGDRIDEWVMARVKRVPGPIEVKRGRVYILPTRFGYGFSVMGLIMLLGAMNYSNSMAFALTFLLAGLTLVCMHQTHGNMVNLSLRAGKSAPVFAGEIAHFELLVDNPAIAPRYALELGWPKDEESLTYGDVPPTSSASLTLSQTAEKRGWHKARVFALGTRFPLGLFRAWTWAELDMACLVYPKPAPAGRRPPPAAGLSGHASASRSGQDEFAGLRSYQRGDSLRSIHWKSLPKTGTVSVKQFTESQAEELWLDWNDAPGADIEAKLSQLTRWVLDAAATPNAYGLRLPKLTLPPSRGEQHQHECLKALALYEAGR